MTYELCDSEYYKETFLKIWKYMEVAEEHKEVQEETVCV